jgi:PrcB C-terminal
VSRVRSRHEDTKARIFLVKGSIKDFLRVLVTSWLILMTSALSAQTQGPRTIEKGDQSNIDDARQVVIRTEAEWTQLWRQHAPDRPQPRIDFSKETVIGLFMGSRPNAGFSTAMVSATEGGGALIVRYTETKPSRDTITAQILTFPYHLAAIPKATATNVKFEKVEQAR